jgi:hypothetical protein
LPNLALIAVQDALHNGLPGSAASVTTFGSVANTTGAVHVFEFSADKRLIDFHAAAFLRSHLEYEGLRLEHESQAVQHKPCRLLGHSQIAVNLIGGDAVLAANQHP